MEELKILIIDDEPMSLMILSRLLKRKKIFNVTETESPVEALEYIKNNYYDVVITDLMMPEIDGSEILKNSKKYNPQCEVILLTGHASIDTAVSVMKNGAFDYIQKPFNPGELLLILDKIKNYKHMQNEAEQISEALKLTEETCSRSIQELEMNIFEIKEKLNAIKGHIENNELNDSEKISRIREIITD